MVASAIARSGREEYEWASPPAQTMFTGAPTGGIPNSRTGNGIVRRHVGDSLRVTHSGSGMTRSPRRGGTVVPASGSCALRDDDVAGVGGRGAARFEHPEAGGG